MQSTTSDLLRAANQAFTTLYAKSDPALTVPQMVVLRALYGHGSQTQTDLVVTTGIDRSTLGTMVADMEARGHLSRSHAGEDRRAKVVAMTPLGRGLYMRTTDRLAYAEKQLLARVPRQHRTAFMEGLLAISAEVR